MRLNTTIRNQRGFSLIELMVVVAIIGILATVAVPQFTKFQNRAKQSEVQTHLSGIFTAEAGFAAQWSSYATPLDTVGYMPSGNVRYNCAAGSVAADTAGNWAAGNAISFDVGAQSCKVLGTCTTTSPDITWQASITSVASTATTFTAKCSTIFKTGNGLADTWTIDEMKTIKQTSNGI